MEHYYRDGKDRRHPLLLLHGTGGDEHSLVNLAHHLAPDSPVLSLRGEVNENGSLRFFRRFVEGQFDLVDLEKRTDTLVEIIQLLSPTYNLNEEDFTIVGYSNGSNIGAHLLLEREIPIKRGIFFHGMSLGKHTKEDKLLKTSVWMSYSPADPIVPHEAFENLVKEFRTRESQIEIFESSMGHQLVSDEIESAKQWFEKIKER